MLTASVSFISTAETLALEVSGWFASGEESAATSPLFVTAVGGGGTGGGGGVESEK